MTAEIITMADVTTGPVLPVWRQEARTGLLLWTSHRNVGHHTRQILVDC